MKLHFYSRVKWLTGLLGAIPYCCMLPHMASAWRNSPLDALDWIFPIVAVAMGLIVLVTSEPAWKYMVKTAVAGAILCLLGFLAVLCIGSVYAFAIIFAMGFWWCILWMLLGWRHAFTLIPPFAILLLSTTSSTYWFCFFLGLSPVQVWILKFALALYACVIDIIIIRYRVCWSQMNTLFIIAMTGALLLLGQTKNLKRSYSPFLLEYKTSVGAFIGREPAPDENFKRFFHTSDAHAYEYASPTHIYNLLAVACGTNIHEIHPASHCLRSSGWQIEREQLIEVTVKNHLFNVTEVEATRNGASLLVWVWYSSENVSTGNFLTFRRLWDARTHWETYQLTVYRDDALDNSRQALVDFLEAFPEQKLTDFGPFDD